MSGIDVDLPQYDGAHQRDDHQNEHGQIGGAPPAGSRQVSVVRERLGRTHSDVSFSIVVRPTLPRISRKTTAKTTTAKIVVEISGGQGL